MAEYSTHCDLKTVANILKQKDNFYILCHKSPDGDTIASALALCLALRNGNKNANVLCSDPIPSKYDYIFKGVYNLSFEPQYIIAVDVADTQLLGECLSVYTDKVDLCIDHHKSNSNYAKLSVINPQAAATAEIIYDLIEEYGVKLTSKIADCIYTGIATDTGCFRYSNVTYNTHMIAGLMIQKDARAAMINKIMFESKTKDRLILESHVLNNLEFYFDSRLALTYITNDLLDISDACDSDTDGLASIAVKIQGVEIGITAIEKQKGEFKVSVRTTDAMDACKFCLQFGGGGHKNASGCVIKGTLSDVKSILIKATERILTKAPEEDFE